MTGLMLERSPGVGAFAEMSAAVGTQPGLLCAPVFAHTFIVDEKESLVVNDRATDGAAELVQMERLLRPAIRLVCGRIEIVARVKRRVAEKIEGVTVKIVGTALGDDVDGRTGAAAVFSLKV